jgi:hypothetical protein
VRSATIWLALEVKGVPYATVREVYEITRLAWIQQLLQVQQGRRGEGMDAANAAWERALERGQAPGR